jgi:hypothetical protein
MEQKWEFTNHSLLGQDVSTACIQRWMTIFIEDKRNSSFAGW